MKLKKILAVISIYLTVANSAFATTYYVAQSGGNDGNSCATATNVNTPKATILGGIGCLAAGDTLQVRAGNYNEELYFPSIPSGTGFPTGATTIMGYSGDPHPVVLKGLWMPGIQNFIWSGIDFNDIGYSNTEFDCINISAGTNFLFTNAEIYNCQRMGIFVYPGNGNLGNLNFTYVNIHDTGLGPNDPGGHAVYLSGNQVGGSFTYTGPLLFDHIQASTTCPGSTVKECWGFQMFQDGAAGNTSINNVTLSNSYIHDSCEGGAILGSGSNNVFYNNIIANNGLATTGCNGEAGLTIGYGQGGSNNQAYNNTIYGTKNGGACISNQQYGTLLTGTILRNNICYSNAGGDSILVYRGATVTQDHNDFGSNPSFTDSTGCITGFGLSSTSVAIGAGANLSSIFTTDYAGNTRPSTGNWYQGACMFINGTPPPPNPPTLSSISPTSGQVGTAVPVTLTGTNFANPITVAAGSGITVSSVSISGTTSLTAVFTIAAAATVGSRSVTVTTAGGTSNAVTFNVTAAPPPPPPAPPTNLHLVP